MHTPTSNLPLIRLSSVNPFLLELGRRNINGGEILERHGLPVDVPASSDLFASAQTIYEIVEESAGAANDPYLGYTIGQKLELSEWEPIAKAIRQAETVGDLLRYFVVNALDHSTSTEFFVRTEGERTTFGFNRATTPSFRPAQNDGFYLGFFTKLRGPYWDANKVLAKVSSPSTIPRSDDLPRLAETGYEGIRISFPTAWQFSKLQKLTLTTRTIADAEHRIPESLIESVHAALRPHIHDSALTVEKAAEICGYGKRKLARKLRAQGTTIVSQIAALRAAEARHQLINSSTRVADIGRSVGFTDPTVFSRAFKKWTGHSPQQYRRTYRH
jgi:AraC-like DNA-binding protein